MLLLKVISITKISHVSSFPQLCLCECAVADSALILCSHNKISNYITNSDRCQADSSLSVRAFYSKMFLGNMTNNLRLVQNKLSFWVKAIHSFTFVILLVCFRLHAQSVINGKIIDEKIQELIAGAPVIIRLASMGSINKFDMNRTFFDVNQKDVQSVNVLNCSICCMSTLHPFLYGEMQHRMHSRLM